MIPLRDNGRRVDFPLVTWTIFALNVIIFIWDRKGNLFGPNVVFADLMMRPSDVMLAMQPGQDNFPFVTLFTSMFLHGGIAHIVGNMIFLVVFGSGVEEAIGSLRYALYYLAWGLVASATHIFVDPGSPIPTLGASGAIGGVLGAYFLLFPGNRIEVFMPLLPFIAFEVAAWILLGVWFLWQIAIPQEGVANWAHAGGFLAGMVTVLVMGGRAAVLQGRDPEYDFT